MLLIGEILLQITILVKICKKIAECSLAPDLKWPLGALPPDPPHCKILATPVL